MKKFNPQFHSNIVRNVRDEAKDANIDTSSYTDEEVYNVFCECYFLSTEDESSEARLEMFKAGVKVTK